MDFGFSPEHEAFKQEVKDFIRENVTPDVQYEIDHGDPESGRRGPKVAELYKKIAAKGWIAISWPKELGGQEGDRMKQYIVEEEFVRIGLNVGGGGGSGGPAILAAGTPEQKAYYLPRIVSGEISFCLGFTEPSGGADLASLQMRAVRDGDDYVINGQKIFTTGAHSATHIYLMARTDPDAPKHKGISIFLVPMDTPGITVRPLWTLQNDPLAPPRTTYGASRTNETYFEDVRVPKSCLLGQENQGWYIGAAGLNLDRVGAWRYLISVMRDEDIINWIKENRFNGYSPASDPAVRDRLAEMWIEAQVSRLMTMRSMSIVERGGDFTYEGSAEKVWAPEHGMRITDTCVQVLGPYAQLLNGSPEAIEQGVFAHNVLGSWISSVNHGSVQVMRDQVARRGLGLPRAT
jgi:alkylation response protein AidB-like acyl-CoA dehydrogenase